MKKLNLTKLFARTLTAALLSASALIAGQADAGVSTFTRVSGVDAAGLDVYLEIRESAYDGYAYDFVILNNSAAGVVTGVYFEQEWTRKIWGVGTPDGPANYYPGSLNPAITGWAGPMGSHTVAADAGIERLADGLQPGQTQIFSFTTDTTKVSLEDLEQRVATTGNDIAIRMQGVDTDPQAETWMLADQMWPGTLTRTLATPVPTPSSAVCLALLGLAAARRRRD